MWATTWLQLVFAFTFIPFFQSHHVHFREGGAEIRRNWTELASAPNEDPISLQNVLLNIIFTEKKMQKLKKIQNKMQKVKPHLQCQQKCTKMYQKVRLELDGISVFKFVSRFQPIPASLSKKTG